MRRGRTFARRAAAALLCLSLLCAGAAASGQEGGTVWGYSEGLALCERGGKWGYVNAQRRVVIPIQYNSAVSFTLGIAAVNLNGKLGVIRQDGAYLIQPEYDTLMPIDCGLYIAQKGGKWGVVSILGYSDSAVGKTNVIYDLVYDSVQVTEQGGTQVLSLEKDGARTMVPLFELPNVLLEKGVPSARFPLNRGRLPSFTDVSPRDWYALWVDLAYNVGLTSGVGNDQFAPGKTLTVAEALMMAANINSRYKGDDFHLRDNPGKTWYSAAVDYCIASGITRTGEFTEQDYTRAITRSEMARVFAATALAREMPQINDLDQVKKAVPDVDASTPAADAIYGLYAKGILSGVDGKFTFAPGGTVTRAEAAAIVSRMARAEQRLILWDLKLYTRSAPIA